MIVRGETYIMTLKTSQMIPTTNDLRVVPCNTNIVTRIIAAKKIASMRSKSDIFLCREERETVSDKTRIIYGYISMMKLFYLLNIIN